MTWVKTSVLTGGYKGFHKDLPVKAGMRVRIPKNTLLKCGNPKHREYRAGGTFRVQVKNILSGSTREGFPHENPKVRWTDKYKYWVSTDINDVEIERSEKDLPSPVYPGHPLVLALYAMHVYPRARLALKTTKHGWAEMVGCCDIPGSGDGAHTAAALIRGIFKKEVSIEDAYEVACGQWTRLVGPGTSNHEKTYEPGIEQAASLQAEFEYVAKSWDWS